MSVECPYCGHDNDIEYSDGEGCREDQVHHGECYECEKHFTYTTFISMGHTAEESDCLNGGEHEWKQTGTHPWEVPRMFCTDCGDEREPTMDEWVEIHKEAKSPPESVWKPDLLKSILAHTAAKAVTA